MFFTYSAHQSRTPVNLMWNIWWNSAGKRMLRYSQLFNQYRFWFYDYQCRLYVVIEQLICYCSVVRLYLSLGFPSFEPLTMLYTSCIHFLSCDCWIACPCMLCLSLMTWTICAGGNIWFYFEFCIYCSEFVQECTEFANLVRERVTNIDGQIQAWWLDSNFSTNQRWKGSSMHMQTSICSALRHRWTANCGFNPNQQQPPHHSTQLWASHPLVPFFRTYSVEDWSVCMSPVFTVLSLEATHYFYFMFHFPS